MAEKPLTSQESVDDGRSDGDGDDKEKLSGRLGLVLALGIFGVGVGAAAGVAFIPEDETVAVEILKALSEAFMVTSLTTLIITFALLDEVRLERILKKLLLPRLVSLLGPATEVALMAHLPPAVAEICARIERAEGVSQQVAGAYVLHRSEIYPRSITLLRELHNGDVRILMSAEEDLTNSPTDQNGDDGSQSSGGTWVRELSKWLSRDFDGNHLIRVIATRPQFAEDVASARERLLLPFEGTNANQWIYADPEFSVSLLLLGDRHAIFGFIPRRDSTIPVNSPRVLPRTTRLEYGVVISNRMLVKNLITWFDDRYAQGGNAAITTKVMTKGEIDDVALRAFADNHGTKGATPAKDGDLDAP